MSGSGRDTEIRLSADTSSLDSSMQASASAAQSAFSQISSTGTAAGTAVTASLGQLEKSLKTAQNQYQQLGGAARDAIAQYIAALQSQIAAIKLTVDAQTSVSAALVQTDAQFQQIAQDAGLAGARLLSFQLAGSQLGTILTNLTAVTTNLDNSGLKPLIDDMTSVGQTTLSAKDSAAAFSSELANTGVSSVTATDKAYQDWRNTLGLTEARLLSAKSQTAEFGTQQAALGAQVSSLSGGSFFDLQKRIDGVGQASLSAKDSAAAFSSELSKTGVSSVTATDKAFQSWRDTLGLTNTRLLSSKMQTAELGTQQGILGVSTANVGRTVKEVTDQMAGLSQEMRTGADVGRQLASQFGQIDEAAGKAGKSIHGAGVLGSGAIQELTRQTRALLTGNWELLPGETLTLLTRMGQLSPAIYGVVGAMAALSLVTVELIRHFRELREARFAAESGPALYNPIVNRAAAQEFFTTLNNMSGVSSKVAGEMADTFGSIQGATTDNVRFMISTIRDLTGGVESRMPQMASTIARAFEAPGTGMRAFLSSIDATGEATRKFDNIVGDNAPSERRVLLMQSLAAAADRVRASTDIAERAQREARLGAAGQIASGAQFGEPDMIAAGRMADATSAAGVEAEHAAERTRLLAAAIGSVTNRTSESAAMSGTWAEKQRAALAEAQEAATQAAQQNNRTPQQTEIIKYEATVEFWKKTLAGETENNKQRLDAQRALSQATTQLTEAQIRSAAAQEATWTQRVTTEIAQRQAQVDISGSKEMISQQQLTQRKLQISADYWKKILEGTDLTEKQRFLAEHAMAIATIGLRASQNTAIVTGAKQGLREQLAALSAEQAANKGNYDEVMRIEEQKLSLIRRSVGERSVLYQQELARKSQLENQGAQEQIQIALRAAQTQASVSRSETTERRAALQEQVATFQISYQEMIATLRQYESVAAGAALQEYDSLVTGLQAGTRAYAQAMDARAKLAANLSRDMQKLATEEAQHDRQTADRKIQIYTQAMSQIGSTVSSSIVGLITKQTTLVGAAQAVARSMLSSFVGLAGQMLARWSALMVAEMLGNQTKNAVIAAQDAGTGSGWSAILSRLLGLFTGAKATEVGVNTAANAAKVTSDVAAAGGSAAAMEGGVIAKKGIATSSISTDAGVAGAGAYAALAGIPIIGPELAAAASEAAIVQVMGYNSLVALDVGAYNVPSDMTARIHKGEMVIPTDFASGIRSNLAGDTGGGGGSPAGGDTHLHYSPSFGAAGGSTGTRSIARRSAAEAMRMLQGVVRNGALGLPGRGAVYA